MSVAIGELTDGVLALDVCLASVLVYWDHGASGLGIYAVLVLLLLKK